MIRRVAIGLAFAIIMFPAVSHAGVKGELGSVSGTVVNAATGEPAAGVCVTATLTLLADASAPPSTRQYKTSTGNDGTYSIENMKPGQYLVVFQTCKGAKAKAKQFAPVTFRDKIGLAPVQPPLVTPGPISPYAELVRVLVGVPSTAIDAAMFPGGTATGRVVNPVGQSLKDICVQARFDLTNAQSTTVRTNGAGRYQIQGLLPRDPDTATEGFELLLEFSDCSNNPEYSTSSISVAFPGPREGVTVDDYTMQKDTSSCVPPGRSIRSDEGITKSEIQFEMKAAGTASVYWLDYSGERVFYNTVSKGQSFVQPTFITHPWVVVGSNGECLGFTVSTKASQTLRIK